ncbi:MAG TPA: FtsW/RodA/SpoVE family cell cycle protein [Candidatus Paceibacterota bacterium]
MKAVAKYDWWLVGSVLMLILISVVTLSSIAPKSDLYKQVVWIFIGLGAIFAVPMINLRPLFAYRWFVLSIYFGILGLLALTYFFAPTISGVRSWLVFGDVQIQSSEFMKLALIILFSKFFAKKHVAIARLGIIIASFIYFLIPAFMILAQPDLGTIIIIFALWLGYVLVSGLPTRYIAIMLLIAVIFGFIAWNLFLYDYQKERIIGLFNPEYDPLGINYSAIQAKIAIGSGGFWGKGFGQGTQTHLGFLPAATTDFVFAAFIEEWGVVGGFVLIAAFVLMIYRILRVGILSNNNFSRFIAVGAVIFFLSHLFINVGSNVGLVPVIGIGLPFVSYGGSNFLTASIMVGIILNIQRHKHGF